MAGDPHCRVATRQPMASLERRRGRREKKVKPSLFLQKGVTECKTARQEEKSETIWSIAWVRFFPGDNVRMKADAVAFACVLVHMAGCYVSTLSPRLYCTAGNVWTVVFSTCHKIRVHSLLSGQQNNPCSAWFKLLLGGSQPPSTPTPSNSSSTAKGTPPKIWKKTSDGSCFCVAHSLLLPLFSCACYLSSKHSSHFALNLHSLASVEPLSPLLLKMEGMKVK